MKRFYLFLLFISLIVSGCVSGIKHIPNKQLSTQQLIQPRPLITNIIEKEIVFINPSKQITVKTDISYTNTFGEPVKIPLEITLKQDSTTNSFVIKNNKYIKDSPFYSSNNFLLLYYGTLILIAIGVWYLVKIYKKKKSKNSLDKNKNHV